MGSFYLGLNLLTVLHATVMKSMLTFELDDLIGKTAWRQGKKFWLHASYKLSFK